VAVSKADDKLGYVGLASGGRRLPPLFMSAQPAEGVGGLFRDFFYNSEEQLLHFA
jgi:hypothetical protein